MALVRLTSIAKQLGISHKTIRTAIANGHLEGLQFGPATDNGKSCAPIWLQPDDVARWVANGRVEVAARWRGLVTTPAPIEGACLPRLLRLAEIARQLGLPAKTVHQAARRGRLTAYRFGDSNAPWYSTPAAVEAWLVNSTVRRRAR